MRRNRIITIIVLILLTGVGWLFWSRVRAPQLDQDLVGQKQQVLVEPKILNRSLPKEEQEKYLADFQAAKAKAMASDLDSPQALHEMALIKKNLGDFEGAILTWEYLGEIRPKTALPFFYLALIFHHDLGDSLRAEKNYLSALANDPSDVEVIRNLFELYFRTLHDNAKAEALLTRSISESPKAAELYAIGGNFYAILGKKEKALEFYAKHLELNPKNGTVIKEIERLKSEIGQ